MGRRKRKRLSKKAWRWERERGSRTEQSVRMRTRKRAIRMAKELMQKRQMLRPY